MQRFNWYFGQEVEPTEIVAAFQAADTFIKNLTADYLAPGFSDPLTLTQADPTPNLTVDANGPARARDTNGERLYFAGPSQNIDLSSVSLPSAGNQKYVTILIAYAEAGSDERTWLDELGDEQTAYYQYDDSYAFTLLEGNEAVAGSAVRPADPGDGRLIVGDVLLSPGQTQILNADIDTLRQLPASVYSGLVGTESSSWSVGVGEQVTSPNNASNKSIKFRRGAKPDAEIRFLEGADASTDAPTPQITVFSDSDTREFKEIGLKDDAGGWQDKTTHLIPADFDRPIKWGAAGEPDASAWIEAVSTTKGFAGINPMTTSQRDLIPSPKQGLLIYNLDTNLFEYWTGAAWMSVGIGSGSGGEITVPEPVTLTQQMIDDGEYLLNYVPSNASAVRWHTIDGTTKRYGTQYTVEAHTDTTVRLVTFDAVALGLDAGDEVLFVYPVGNPGTLPIPAANTSVAGMTENLTGLTSGQAIFDWLDSMTDTNVPLNNQSYAGNLSGATDQSDVNDLVDALVDEHITLFDTYAGNLAGMLTQDEVNDWLDALSLSGGSGGPSIMGGRVLLVDPNHNDAADDTDVTTPFLTLQQAHDQADTNDLLVVPGSYGTSQPSGGVTITKSISILGLSTSPVNIFAINIEPTTPDINVYVKGVNTSALAINTAQSVDVYIYDSDMNTVADTNYGTSSRFKFERCRFLNGCGLIASTVTSAYFKNCTFVDRVDLNATDISIEDSFVNSPGTSAAPALIFRDGCTTVRANNLVFDTTGSAGTQYDIGIQETGTIDFLLTNSVLQADGVSIAFTGSGTLNLTHAGTYANSATANTGGGTFNKTAMSALA